MLHSDRLWDMKTMDMTALCSKLIISEFSQIYYTLEFTHTFCMDHLKVLLSCKLKKHLQMIAYVFQKYPEKFTVRLFIILQ